MRNTDNKFEEMLAAAKEAGLTVPSPRESAELESLWEDLDADLRPPEEEQGNLRLAAYRRDRRPRRKTTGTRIPFPPLWAVLAGLAALLAFGILLIQSMAMRATIQKMDTRMRQMNAAMILASLHSDSPADRLDGLLKLAVSEPPGPSVLQAVQERLVHDSNTNVRLASVNTLARFADHPDVRKSLIAAARSEHSPMVVIGIMEILWRTDPVQAEALWKELQEDSRFPFLRKDPENGDLNPSTTQL